MIWSWLVRAKSWEVGGTNDRMELEHSRLEKRDMKRMTRGELF